MLKKYLFLLLASFFSTFFVAYNFVTNTYSAASNIPEYESGRFCNFTLNGVPTGDVTFANDCVVYENVNGVANGNLILQSGATVTLHHDLVYYPGYKIDIQPGAVIFVNSDSQIKQGKICILDADGDGYADPIDVSTDPGSGVSVDPGTSELTQLDSRIVTTAPYTCDTNYVSRENFTSLAYIDTGVVTAGQGFATGDNVFLSMGFTINNVADVNAAAGDIQVPNTKNLIMLPGGTGGKIGIGITNPTAGQLMINVGTNQNMVFRTVLGNPNIAFHNDGSSAYVTGRVDASPLVLNQNSGGNVGIGVTNPARRFSVAGGGANLYTLNVGGIDGITNGEYTGLSFGDDTGGTVYGAIKFNRDAANDYSMRFLSYGGAAGGSERMTIDGATGNVGIGNTAPSSKLEVTGGVRMTTLECMNGNCPANGVVRLTPNLHLNSGAGNAVIVNWDNGTTGATQTFRVGNGASADVFYVRANGSSVQSSTNEAPLYRATGSGNPGAQTGGFSFNSPGDTDGGIGSTADGTMQFYTNSAETMRLNATGLGIGIAGATQKLEVNGNIKMSPANPYLYSGGSYIVVPQSFYISTAAVPFYTEARIQARGGISNDNGGWLEFYGGASAVSRFQGQLKVGVNAYTNQAGDLGTSRDAAPTTGVIYLGNNGSYYFYFNGTSYQTGGATGLGIGASPGTYRLYVPGSFYAGGSSRDWKENISPLQLDSSKIYQLEPVTYDYKQAHKGMGKELSGGRQFGLIAEDVYEVYPELALSSPDKKVANVDYEKLSVLLLAEMKNHKKEIDLLKAKNAELEKRLQIVEQKLNTLVK